MHELEDQPDLPDRDSAIASARPSVLAVLAMQDAMDASMCVWVCVRWHHTIYWGKCVYWVSVHLRNGIHTHYTTA